MGIGNAAVILEQIGVIVLSAFLLYFLYQWLEGERDSEKDIESTLQKAKTIRQEAMERSRELLSRAEQ